MPESLGERIQRVARQLHEADALLDDAIVRCEASFVAMLGPETRGRVHLARTRGLVEHLVFREGRFLIESGRLGRPLDVIPLREAERESKIRATDKLRDLWLACGGRPRP